MNLYEQACNSYKEHLQNNCPRPFNHVEQLIYDLLEENIIRSAKEGKIKNLSFLWIKERISCNCVEKFNELILSYPLKVLQDLGFYIEANKPYSLNGSSCLTTISPQEEEVFITIEWNK